MGVDIKGKTAIKRLVFESQKAERAAVEEAEDRLIINAFAAFVSKPLDDYILDDVDDYILDDVDDYILDDGDDYDNNDFFVSNPLDDYILDGDENNDFFVSKLLDEGDSFVVY